jgi:hypothetical protein
MAWASEALRGCKEMDLHDCDLLAQERDNRAVKIFGNFPVRSATPKIFPQNPSE